MLKKQNKTKNETIELINKDHKVKLVLYQNSNITFTERESIIFNNLTDSSTKCFTNSCCFMTQIFTDNKENRKHIQFLDPSKEKCIS